MTNKLCDITISRSWYILTFVIAILSVITYLYLDLPLYELLYPYRGTPAFYPIDLLTDLGKSTWYIIVSLILFVIWRNKKPTYSDMALLILSTTIVSGILVNIPKVIFGRARPQLFADENIYGFFWFKLEVLYRSFPSGHATTAMAVWLAFALLFPRYRYWLITMGILISMSRVMLTQHYLSDILVGGWIGAMATLILYQIVYTKESKDGN